MINDILHDNDIIHTSFFIPLGLFVFIFSQAFLLSRKFAIAFKKIEIMSMKISNSNQELSAANEEFLAMNEELIASQEEIESSEKKVIKAEAYLNNIFNSMPSILVGVDNNSNITMWNSKAIDFTNISEKDAINKNFTTLFTEFKINEDLIKRAITGKTPQKITNLKTKNKNDKKEYWDIAIYPLVNDNIEGAVIRIENITESIIQEEQLLQSQKMETVGTLAGGIAHDFNNILGGIVGTLSIMKYEINSNIEIDKTIIKSYVNTMEESSSRAKDMTQQLLSLSSKTETTFITVDLNHSIKNIIKICENSFDKSIHLDPHYRKTPAIINGDPTQIEQTLLNLAINASHAMTIMKTKNELWGGILTISLDKIKSDHYFQSTHPTAEKIEYWVLSVKDTGIGMSSNLIDKIFTPFFTTKDKSRGTGLGLAMGFNIIKQHNGFIDVYSEEGIGSTFNIFLPVAKTDILSEEKPEEEYSPHKGKGNILIIDDDNIMRNTAEIILTKCGYNIITAKNGEEGVKIFSEKYTEIKAILLDLVMPVMSGKEAYMEMKTIQPDVKVLLSSGFRQDQRVEDILKLGVKDFLQKPYTLQSLSEAIEKTINN